MKPRSASRVESLREAARSIRRVCRQIAGIPDYESYLAHMGKHHPGEPLLSQREFFARAIDHKYGRGRSRCC